MTTLPFDDELKLFVMMRTELYSAVLCDALDQLGFRKQAMRADIRPIYPDAVVVGYALGMCWSLLRSAQHGHACGANYCPQRRSRGVRTGLSSTVTPAMSG